MTIVSIDMKLPVCLIVCMFASRWLRMLNARDYAYAMVAMLCQQPQR